MIICGNNLSDRIKSVCDMSSLNKWCISIMKYTILILVACCCLLMAFIFLQQTGELSSKSGGKICDKLKIDIGELMFYNAITQVTDV